MFPPDKCVCTLRSHLTESMSASQISPLLTCFLEFTLFLSLGDSRRSSCSRAEIWRRVLQEVPQPKHHCVSHQLRQGNTFFFTSFVWLSYSLAFCHFRVWRSTCAQQAGQVLIDGSSSRRATFRPWTFCSRTTEQNSCSTGSPSLATFQKPRVRTSTPSCCPKPGESGFVAPFSPWNCHILWSGCLLDTYEFAWRSGCFGTGEHPSQLSCSGAAPQAPAWEDPAALPLRKIRLVGAICSDLASFPSCFSTARKCPVKSALRGGS